jgi:AcrR family transcriptional regulator
VLSAQAIASAGRRGISTGSVLSRRGDILVSRAQRARMLDSAVKIIAEGGYEEMSVARISGVAGVSRRTFYDLFEDREDCFLAAFNASTARASEAMATGYAQGSGWLDQTRRALLALLRFLDSEPGVCSLLIVDALKAGPTVQKRRAQILGDLSRVLHEDAPRNRTGKGVPALMGEGVAGSVFSVIHSRLFSAPPAAMVELLNPLMAMIVLPYLGTAAAHRELERPTPAASPASASQPAQGAHTASAPPMRVTYRTLLVLAVIGENPGASNRQIAGLAGISDQGQMSRLLTRLERLGLTNNTGPNQPAGGPNKWQLTPQGRQATHVAGEPSNTQEAR